MGLIDWIARLLFGPPDDQGASSWRAPAAAAPPAPPARRERPRSETDGLDIAQFAPLDDEQVRKQAGRLGFAWSNAFFGRRDLIPPASDPRTLLIDRAMVGHGLLTPEELADIHRVGAEMDRVRPDLALAAEEARLAVAQVESDRETLKRQKKAEAAERRRRHAEAVAHRRATDIVFLGRGVSKGLCERESDVARLEAAGLPVLSTPADVAEAMGFPIPRLRWLAFHTVAAARVHYVSFTVPKKSGGERTLSAPHRDLARAQEWILRGVLDRIPVHDAAHGFVRGRSTVTGAAPHAGTEIVLNMDVRDFFPTITFPRVKGVFRQLGYSPAVATILALLCTECPRRTVQLAGQTLHDATGPRGLPQGACTSPALSNLVTRRLDARLRGVGAKIGWTYTRYADDMTFSSSGEPVAKIGWLIARVRHLVQDEGFAIHPGKTRVQRRHTAQTVTGIVVNDRPGVPRETVRRLRAILHRARREGLAAQNRENRPHFEAWVRGMIAYIRMVNPSQGEPLKAAFDALAAP